MILIVMGVSGCGKSSVGHGLAERLGWTFFDGDKFHSEENLEKMRCGVPLTDVDRRPWLERINQVMSEKIHAGQNAIFACSALKRSYRRILAGDNLSSPKIYFAHLVLSFELAQSRMELRTGHFFNPNLLRNQFQTLEAPDWSEESGFDLNMSQPLSEVIEKGVQRICSILN